MPIVNVRVYRVDNSYDDQNEATVAYTQIYMPNGCEISNYDAGSPVQEMGFFYRLKMDC